MSRRLRLVIDALPDSNLTKNRQQNTRHTMVTARRKSAERQRAGWLILAALNGERPEFRVPVRVTFSLRFPVRRRRDKDGWTPTISPWLDILAVGPPANPGLGIIYDDSSEWATPVLEFEPEPGEPRTIITIEPRNP